MLRIRTWSIWVLIPSESLKGMLYTHRLLKGESSESEKREFFGKLARGEDIITFYMLNEKPFRKRMQCSLQDSPGGWKSSGHCSCGWSSAKVIGSFIWKQKVWKFPPFESTMKITGESLQLPVLIHESIRQSYSFLYNF